MHILRRAAIFFIPLLCLAFILSFMDRWVTHQKRLKTLPNKNIEAEAKKQEVEYKLKVLRNAYVGNSSELVDTKNSSFFTVVIDPTHGGDDIGNIGYKSAVESNLNLLFSFKLARALRMKGIKVYLTRMDDTNIPFELRKKEALKRAPNLYLSINCSYSDIKSLRGIEIYGYTPEDLDGVVKAQDAMVIENRVSLAIKEGLDLPYRSALERKYLKLMSLPFDVPTLGIFIGYISNAEDVTQLENEKYINELSEKMAISIEKGLQKKI